MAACRRTLVLSLTLVSGVATGDGAVAPTYAFLAPVRDVWQVWIGSGGRPPRPLTDDAVEKVSLSAAAATGEILAVTRDGTGILMTAQGQRLAAIDLGPGVDDAALSPDGRWIAFVREESIGTRERRVWIIDRSGAGRRRLLDRAGFQHGPAWSPDGAAIACTASGPGGAEDVFLVRVDGSGDRQITVGTRRYLEPAFAPDGGILVSTNRAGDDYDIWRLDPGTGEAAPAFAAPGYDGQPAVSPDGRRVLFVSRRSGHAAVWVAAPDGTAAERLTSAPTQVKDPVWVAGSGDRLAFLRATDGGWQPWTARLDGTDLKPIARLKADPSRITLAADGRTLLANGLDGSLVLVDTSEATTRAIAVDPPGPTDAALSPDARRIAYSVNTLGGIDSNDIWVVPVGGGRAKKITEQPFLQHFPVWGPDDVLLYLSGKGGQNHDVWRVKADGGKPALVIGERLYNFEPAMSPKGDLAFSSNREGNYDIWLQPAGGGEPRRVTSDPAWDGQPAFSAEGTRIAYVSRRGGASRIWIHDLGTGNEVALPVDGHLRMPLWFPGGSGR